MKRSITSSESENLLSKFFEGKYSFLGAKLENHKKVRGVEDTYTLTVDKMSIDFIKELSGDPRVITVYYNPLHPPQGLSYGLNLRYRLYIKYEKVDL